MKLSSWTKQILECGSIMPPCEGFFEFFPLNVRKEVMRCSTLTNFVYGVGKAMKTGKWVISFTRLLTEGG